jgi:hypothetical protein
MTDHVTNGAQRAKDRTNNARQKRFRDRRKAEAQAATVMPSSVVGDNGAAAVMPVMPTIPAVMRSRDWGVTMAAYGAAIGLASVSGFFGVVGMTAIYAAAPVPVMVMTAVLEGAKLVTAAWLARNWRDAPLALRAPLIGIVIALMALTAVGTYGFFVRAHLAHQLEARQAIDNAASPVAEKIKSAEVDLHDLDGRIRQFDDMVRETTSRGRTRVAMALVDGQAKKRSDLVTERRTVAARLADLRVQVSAVEARRAQSAAELGPARYLAELLGWADGETAVKLITLLLVLVIDPAAILLTLAASRRATGYVGL